MKGSPMTFDEVLAGVQVMGDGIMALFGAPIAREDRAVRACYAALAWYSMACRWQKPCPSMPPFSLSH